MSSPIVLACATDASFRWSVDTSTLALRCRLGASTPSHHVHRLGDDGAVMGARFRAADAVRREQVVPAHQAPDPPGGGADAGVAQPGPDLAVALAVQARAEDLRANVAQQLGIGAGADRASARRA